MIRSGSSVYTNTIFGFNTGLGFNFSNIVIRGI